MTHFPFQLLRVLKWGSSWVVVIPRALRESLMLQPGDYLAVRVHAPFATMRRCQVETIMPMQELAVDMLPPAKITRESIAKRQDSASEPSAPAAEPDAGHDGRGKAE